jgi:hypothetical protein
VFPPISQEVQRLRAPFANDLAKMMAKALSRGRHSAYVIDGDTDPRAPSLGSFVWPFAGFWHTKLAKWKKTHLTVEKGEARAVYHAIQLQLAVEERVVEGDFPAFDGTQVTITGPEDDPIDLVTMQLDVP